ncbi:MAG TPA: LysR family transcriptional regulator [Longimicrobium sp.]|nr:LysR family transcriptional regulator [Longimicrobium sp.]
MQRINYNHLWYFWMVAREGSISAAAKKLDVTQPAVSSQVARLQRSLGTKLFEKSGRGLALTPAGATVYGYADEMFELAREMLETLDRGGPRALRLAVGVAEGFPAVLTHRLLAPATMLPRPVRLKVRHGSLARLTAELGARELDLVLCTERLPAGSAVRARPHALGECGVVLLAEAEMAQRLAPGFPGSLDGVPFVLPPSSAPLRRTFDQWLQAQGAAPAVVAEMDDWSEALLLAQSGAGVVVVPAAAEEELRQLYRLQVVGHARDAVQHFYALTAERRPRNRGVVAVLESARTNPFR